MRNFRGYTYGMLFFMFSVIYTPVPYIVILKIEFKLMPLPYGMYRLRVFNCY